jgi:hypothetical protein
MGSATKNVAKVRDVLADTYGTCAACERLLDSGLTIAHNGCHFFVARPLIGSVKMAYISSVANKWPMLLTAGRIILAFSCAATLAWLASNLVVR